MADSLLCPKCGSQIEVSTVLASQIRDHLRREYEAESRRKDAAVGERENKLWEREQALDAQQNNLEIEVARRLSEEKMQLFKQAEVKAKESLAVEFGDLQNENAEMKRKLDNSHKAELQFRKDRRELEAQKQELELAVSR